MMLFENESYELIGAGMAVHRELANGYLEAVYQEAFAVELEARGIPYEREKPLKIHYRDRELGKCYYADFFCHGQIIVNTTGCKLGLLFNFGVPSFQHRRLVL